MRTPKISAATVVNRQAEHTIMISELPLKRPVQEDKRRDA
jgi:hypothetical protein